MQTPESSASAGSRARCAAARALRSAFSRKVEPVLFRLGQREFALRKRRRHDAVPKAPASPRVYPHCRWYDKAANDLWAAAGHPAFHQTNCSPRRPDALRPVACRPSNGAVDPTNQFVSLMRADLLRGDLAILEQH